LNETHSYLRRLRAEIDEHYSHRVLLAWADHWPSEAVVYFGNPDGAPECNMVLYTSLMPRIFLSMRQESHVPVSSLLAGANAIPDTCQWGIFLRNGDEMSLDTIDEDGREFLLKEYAPSQRMRTSYGIRRRLAPLLDGDRDQIELCMAMLLSLPGSPVLYYGDEIGMGENLMLPGCRAIRTPMHWSTERSAGFSSSEQEELEVPILLNSAYGYQAANVDAQRERATSLLNSLRSLIEVRRNSGPLMLGSFTEVTSTNSAIMAYVRQYRNERMLCVVNFSRYPQPTELDLDAYSGDRLIEVMGGSRFAPVCADYPLTLAGHGFFWFRVVS
jgi:maltose alpha-D-glucosyltransferase/alpha-amylase